MYAIVDIETTGSYAAAHGITEISILVFDGEKITDRFESLINPGQPIPRFIQSMTGITDAMVAKAPRFEELAPRIHDILKDNVFVAHNVHFDYSFVKSHLMQAGLDLLTKKLCTVRLSRKIIPGLPAYSLGKLCRQLGIPMENRHRAGGDAAATVELFRRLLQEDRENHIGQSLQRNSRESVLPPHVPKAHFEKLPRTPGVYYFHDKKGKIIYIGKALNIRQRVGSHFANNSGSRQKQNFVRYTHGISYQPLPTELMASILESAEIKKKWPLFNASQKRWEEVYGIFRFEDQAGYQRLAIEKKRRGTQPLYTFHYLVDGHAVLRQLVKDHGLCARLCFLEKQPGACAGHESGECRGACLKKEKPAAYNRRVEKAVETLLQRDSFAILDEGWEEGEQSCILVENGEFYGMGLVPADMDWQDLAEVKEHLTRYRENSFIRHILQGYAARYPEKVRVFLS